MAQIQTDEGTGDQTSFEVSVASRNETAACVDPCDLCLVNNLQSQLGSPYFDGPSLATAKRF